MCQIIRELKLEKYFALFPSFKFSFIIRKKQQEFTVLKRINVHKFLIYLIVFLALFYFMDCLHSFPACVYIYIYKRYNTINLHKVKVFF